MRCFCYVVKQNSPKHERCGQQKYAVFVAGCAAVRLFVSSTTAERRRRRSARARRNAWWMMMIYAKIRTARLVEFPTRIHRTPEQLGRLGFGDGFKLNLQLGGLMLLGWVFFSLWKVALGRACVAGGLASWRLRLFDSGCGQSHAKYIRGFLLLWCVVWQTRNWWCHTSQKRPRGPWRPSDGSLLFGT